ncbi:hypothetical protein EOS93_31050 [Rhizobium sp. RMa-01]|uniref:hypothetical protein n=1 Tax=unclassified Rhizobium TaxID=2613769 RepID=UPI000911E704|nr:MULTISPECIES: hypothetical protein [unclassified Rhizobium]OHV22591.1 hypothetical protein BBJ66_29435 [Rhizobium sp. RSm-3]RVU05263.1 hypothetical protein EOS93_31050 [Rhizobium sp. RMa-01]
MIQDAEMPLRKVKSELDKTMADIDFMKISDLLYGRKGDGEIQTLVEWNLFGKPINNFACDFGLRNSDALKFSEECLKLYSGAFFGSEIQANRPFNVRCQLGQYYSWGVRSSLRLSDYNHDLLLVLDKTQSDIQRFIGEKAGSVSTIEEYCDLLIGNPDWMPWDWSHGAARAAEYVFVASKIGISPSDMRGNLAQYENVNIKSGLNRSVNVHEYLEKVIRHLEISRGVAK